MRTRLEGRGAAMRVKVAVVPVAAVKLADTRLSSGESAEERILSLTMPTMTKIWLMSTQLMNHRCVRIHSLVLLAPTIGMLHLRAHVAIVSNNSSVVGPRRANSRGNVDSAVREGALPEKVSKPNDRLSSRGSSP